jgi:lipopolysaccharide/colanic/teichoic acid biosynthesis glycosyltransferase
MVVPEAGIVRSAAEMKEIFFQKLWDCLNLLQSHRNPAKGAVLNRIHSADEFRLLLERERVRTERTGVKFSLVIFDVESQENPLVNLERLAEVLTHRVRSTDGMGWFGEREIGVLLINTSMEGAWKFASEILQKIPDAPSARSFKVYTYPVPWQAHQEDDSKDSRHSDLTRPIDRALLQGSFETPPPSLFHSPLMTGAGMEELLVRRLPVWKRLIDIVGSIIGLLLFSPLMFAVAVSIKLTSPGPILFKQERVGHLGGRFTLLKFRTMYFNNNPDIHKKYVENFIKNCGFREAHRAQAPTYKIENDPRVTPIGKLLRKASLDELPQFINVLKGEMSLVGPRPPIPYEYEQYDIWHKRRAWEVQPGITGLWQIKGRSRTTFDQMARLDLKYLKEWSLWLDLKILIQTPWAVFTARGAH